MSMYKRMEMDSHLRAYIKINFKWVIDLNIRAITIKKKLLGQNIGINLHNLELDNDFLYMTDTKALVTKEKN